MTNSRTHDHSLSPAESMPGFSLGREAISGSGGVEADLLHGSLVRIVRIAMGRIGGKLTPWLDEGLLMSQGLVTLLEISGDDRDLRAQEEACGGGERTLRRVVSGMRDRARASSWFARAWPCRIAPLCASLAYRGDDGEEAVAGDLGLEPPELAGRYTEAGLVFGVSPELMLPDFATPRVGSRNGGEGPGRGVLAQAISMRPVEQRRVLTLYFQEGLSFPEIAELLELPPERAQELYGRAAAAVRARVMLGASGSAGMGA